MSSSKILAFAGSIRAESFNRRALQVAVKGARDAGGEVTVLDLRDYPLPIYDGDLEQQEGLPHNAKLLKEIFDEHGAFLIACPEYNSSITPLLKNTIDWVSRPLPDEGGLAQYKGKVAGLVAASPGALGGLRCLYHVRDILQNIQVMVITNMRAVPKANEVFDAKGNITDEKMRQGLESVGADLAKTVAKLKG